MAAAPTPATPAAEALLGALADWSGATATELAQAAGIGRSTAAKLLAALAGQGRVLRQPGGHHDGGWAPASCASWCWAAWPSGRGRRCHLPRSPRHWTARPARSPTPCGSWPAKAR
jgi:IclR helix-turn-helix domain